MRYIIEQVLDNERTFYGPFLIRSHAERVIDKLIENDNGAATYHLHSLRPQAQLEKPI